MKFERWYSIKEIKDMGDTEEVERLRAKKKQIYEDLKDDINEWFEYTPQEKNT